MLGAFTPRENEILQLINLGLTNDEIAQRLIISRGTVKAHTHNIYSKLGVANRMQAMLKAGGLGLLEISTAADVQADKTTPATAFATTELPIEITPLIGREHELSRLAGILADDRTRMVTILGAGGMGKSRLALALAEQQRSAFEDGVCFVELTQVTDRRQLVNAVSDALGLRFQTSEPPEKQLVHYLRDQHRLIVLDNFEHLLEAAHWITDLLRAAPEIRFLVTSRERLNLSTEVVFVLGGLDYESAGNAGAVDGLSEAARLLVERAQFSNPTFSPTPDDQPHLLRICKLTEGMPLALILAAGWMEMLTLEEVADHLSRSLDILESQLRDLPARQRSMRATIASSWERLSPEERTSFVSLCVFRKGFTREAAQHVTGISLPQLQTLVNRSFVSVRDGRYSIHELLRQFAESYQPPDLRTHLQAAHCAYYADILNARFQDFVAGERLPQIISEFVTEQDNLQAAWTWAISELQLNYLDIMVQPFAVYYHTQSRYSEGMHVFEAAAVRVQEAEDSVIRSRVLGSVFENLGYYYIRFGRLDDAESAFIRSRSYQEAAEYWPTISATDPMIGLSLCASIRGNYAEAIALAEQALEENERRQHVTNQAYTHYTLAGIRLAQGNYLEALNHAARAVHLAMTVRDQWLLAHCQFELGHVLRVLGKSEQAESHYQSAYQLYQKYGDLVGMATALGHLAQMVLDRQDYAEAKRLFQQSATLCQQTQDQGGLASALHGLGQVALQLGDEATCREHLKLALELANDIEYLPLLFAILLDVAELRLSRGQIVDGLALLSYVQQHPSSKQETKDRASERLTAFHAHRAETAAELQQLLPPSADITQVVASIRAELTAD